MIDHPLPSAAPSAYQPAWWLSNPHVSTMWGKFFRSPPALDASVERLCTPDGDILDVVRTKAPAQAPEEAPTFLLLHGLEGTLRSHYAAGMLREAQRHGWQANLLLFRSCNGEPNRAARSYHSGETTDLQFTVERLLEERPRAPLVLAGVSLGGNVLLKWLGERGDSLSPHVAAAVAVSTPFDLARSCAHIDSGFARLYAWNFLRTLKAKALEKIRQHPGIADPARVAAANSLWAFDDAFTSVVHGFVDAADYYYQSSSIRYLHAIRVPTLLLSARDDPFHPPEVLHDVEDIARHNPSLHLEFPARGGHVGFVEGLHPARTTYYMERRITHFANTQLGGSLHHGAPITRTLG
ncbi:MAG: hydrolase [Gemmatimonadaceae bacterium]|nr:hydrolase [Gemmatimonadaceae bacterium]